MKSSARIPRSTRREARPAASRGAGSGCLRIGRVVRFEARRRPEPDSVELDRKTGPGLQPAARSACRATFMARSHSSTCSHPGASPAAKNIRCFWRQCERSALFLHRSMWDIAVVKFWFLLPRLLSILAVVSLLIVPMAAPSVAMAAASAPAMEGMASISDAMPCCPHEKPALPDCPKSCPLAALCMTGCLAYAPVSGPSMPARFAIADVKSPGDDVEPERLTEPPSHRPPRT
jgi:hypothetical protein